MAVELNICADLAVPSLVEILIGKQSLMEEIRRSSGGPDNVAGARERAVGCYDRDVRIRKNVLTCAQLKAGEVDAVWLERLDIFFVEAVETNVVVEEKA